MKWLQKWIIVLFPSEFLNHWFFSSLVTSCYKIRKRSSMLGNSFLLYTIQKIIMIIHPFLVEHQFNANSCYMGCKKYSIQLKKFRGEGKRTVPMVTYTILHDFTTCDPCHVFNKTMMIIISYFQKNEHYLILNKRSFDKNNLLYYILDLNRRKAIFTKLSMEHGGNTAQTKNNRDKCGKCNSSLTLSRQNCGELHSIT